MNSVHLIGGGRDETLATPLFTRFLADAAVAGRAPRIHLLLVLEDDDTESVSRYSRLLSGADVEVHAITEGERFGSAAVTGADGIAVGGGLTPAYLDAIEPITGDIRVAVAGGVPYLGFSAGAAIAADRALVGGWLLDGVPVGDEDAAEELDELTVRDGIGLVPFTVDVHAAQWGTLSRLVAAVDAGLVAGGHAIDEHTALVVSRKQGAPEVTGAGAAWHVTPGRPVARRTAR
jgi:cyanophycinase